MVLADESGLELNELSCRWTYSMDLECPGTLSESDHSHPMAMLERAVLELCRV